MIEFMARFTLYAVIGSLYSGKVRAYLRQQHIDFVERPMSDLGWRKTIVPQIGRNMIPVVVTPEGDILQDSTAILDHFEASDLKRFSIVPQAPVMRAVSHLFELVGCEGLLRPAMYYRWYFDELNADFLNDMIRDDILPDGLSDEVYKKMLAKLRVPVELARTWGVTEDNFAGIETSYEDFLARFNAHLANHPFLLGGQPCAGDFSLLNPLFGHLGRDVKPALMMVQTAPKVNRWKERMNSPETILDERAVNAGPNFFADDQIPGTLKNLMEYFAGEYLPELTAHVTHANAWLAERPELAEGTTAPEMINDRNIGMSAPFDWQGKQISTAVHPYRFWLLQRLQDAEAAVDEGARKEIRSLFDETGLGSIFDLKTSRRVERRNNLEIWGRNQ